MNSNVPTQIVVIHDDIDKLSPIYVTLEQKYGEDNVSLFQHSHDGLNYVMENLGKKMVVLLDKNFDDGKEIDGIEVFERIREKTSLVYVILITVSPISDIDPIVLKRLINKDLFKIESFTSDYTLLIELVDEAVQLLDVRVDAVIEEWIVKHNEKQREQILLKTKEGREYTMGDILNEIRQQSEIGLLFEKNLLKLAIELFGKQKMRLNG